MSTVRIMSHEDSGAPTLLGYNRTAFYTWMETILSVGYNQKNILNITRNGRYLTLTYSVDHGYRKGHLLQLENSPYAPLDGLYRVTSIISTTSLTIYLKDEAWDSYPATLHDLNTSTKVAPLGWDVVYKTNEQISFRSPRTDSSGVVITLKKPTYPHGGTALKTTSSVVFELDLSKDIDLTTGSTIDSCFIELKAQQGHSCFYWILSTNNPNLESGSTWTSDTLRAPWGITGDDKFFFFTGMPFADGYEDGYYRQYSTTWNSSYRSNRTYAFGDIDAADPLEYSTGSSFFFSPHYYAHNGDRDNLATSDSSPWNSNPFGSITGTYTNRVHFFSEYDPKGTFTNARIVTGGSAPYDATTAGSGSDLLWNAYPERVAGGITYFKYFACANEKGVGRNTFQSYMKGEFPIVRALVTNLRNFATTARGQHRVVFDTDEPTKMLYTYSFGQYGFTSNLEYNACHLFELD